MQTENDDDRDGGQRSSEVKWGKLLTRNDGGSRGAAPWRVPGGRAPWRGLQGAEPPCVGKL